MAVITIPFELLQKSGVLTVCYEPNQSLAQSGFALFASDRFDPHICLGYPTMRAAIRSFEGAGYYTACAWIQIVTRREFASAEVAEPAAVVVDVDTHPTLEELGVPFFAFGFPAEIFDAPCNNLGGLGRLEWTADTFLVTLPSRANNDSISPVAGFCWGYRECDLNEKRQVESRPLEIIDVARWRQHVPLLRSRFGRWNYAAG
jgi:hypothetical protein